MKRAARHQQLLGSIDRIYEAALDPVHWERALADAAEYVGGIAADIYITHGASPPQIAFHGIPDELMRDYLAHYHAHNPRVSATEACREGGGW